jgi:CDP-paratose 2-epimerase
MKKTNKKILITGGAGFIGSNTAFYFSKKGWKIYLIDNLSRKGSKNNLLNLKKNIKLIFYKADISNFKKISKILKSIRPNLIIHCAGQVTVTKSVVNPRNDFNTNALGSFNILESIRLFSNKTKFINISTNKVYGDVLNKKVSETNKRYRFLGKLKSVNENYPLDLYSPYGCSKGIADQYTRDYSRVYNLDTIVLRLSCIYGTMQYGIEDQGWIVWLTIKSYFGKKIKIFGNGKQVRDALYIDDLVRLFFKLSKSKKNTNKIYNIGGGSRNSISLLELINILDKKMNKKNKFKKFKWRPGDQKIYISDISKIKKEYNWYPKISFSDGLDKIIGWINKNEMIIKKTLNP